MDGQRHIDTEGQRHMDTDRHGRHRRVDTDRHGHMDRDTQIQRDGILAETLKKYGNPDHCGRSSKESTHEGVN